MAMLCGAEAPWPLLNVTDTDWIALVSVAGALEFPDSVTGNDAVNWLPVLCDAWYQDRNVASTGIAIVGLVMLWPGAEVSTSCNCVTDRLVE